MRSTGRRPTTALPGAVVLVTGGGNGIGAATALALARAGSSTVLVVDRERPAAEKSAAACEEVGAGAEALVVDVADAASMTALAEEVQVRYGPLDVLVNNAGVGMTGRFLDVGVEDWEWIRSINLDGVLNGCRAFGPAMVARGRGHVVNVSSGLAYTPRATEPAYVTTKAAVLAFSQCLRADWGQSGVGVSAICPGLIDTGILDRARFLGDQADARSVSRARQAFKRGHSPSQVADAIVTSVLGDRAVVTVGWEAKLGWASHRLAPLSVQQLVARAGPRSATVGRVNNGRGACPPRGGGGHRCPRP